MDFDLSAEQRDLQKRAEVAGLALRSRAREWDEAEAVPLDDVIREVGEHGLLGLTMPVEVGGQGGTALDYAIAAQEIIRASQSWIAAEPLFYTSGPAPSMMLLAESGVVRERYLPDVVAGRKACAIALTEPDHGSDLTHLEATARRDGDVFVLNGSKRFVTGSPWNDLYAVFVRMTDEPGAKGIGAVIVEKGAPGLRLERGPSFVGVRGIPHGEMHFRDCRVPADNLIIGAGRFAQLMGAFNMERLHNSVYHLGFAQAAFDEAVAYVEQRSAFGRNIIEFQATYHALADMWVQIEAQRMLAYRAACTAEDGVFPLPLDVSISKLFGVTMAPKVSLTALELHGGDGTTLEFPIQRIHRDVITGIVAGGAPAVLRNSIASHLFPHRRFPQTKF